MSATQISMLSIHCLRHLPRRMVDVEQMVRLLAQRFAQELFIQRKNIRIFV